MNRNKDFIIKAIIVVLAILLIGCGVLYMISSIAPANSDSSLPVNQTINSTPAATPGDPSDGVDDGNGETVEPEATDPNNAEDQPSVEESISPSPAATLHPTDWDYDGNPSGNMPYPKDKAVKDYPYYIKVNKSTNVVTVLKKDDAGEYTQIAKTFLCSVGRKTPTGTFHLQEKYYWKSLIHGVWGQYSTRITGDVLFHSVPYDGPKKDKLIIHYYNQLGSTASAGCVRLTTKSARWIVKNCPTGTSVEIYYGTDLSPKRPTAQRLDGSIRWDPTDPDTRNPWNTKESQLFGVMNRTIERGDSATTLKGVYAFDANTKRTSTNVKVESELDTKVPGSYPVTYSYTDSTGKVLTKEVTYTVKDTKAPVFTGLPATYYIKDASLGTKDKLMAKLRATDNGEAIKASKIQANVPATIQSGKNVATFTVTDEYNHTAKFTCNIVLDTEPPVLKFKKNIANVLPITQKITDAWARKRVDTKDTLSFTKKEVDWGYEITYKAKDPAGNTTTLKETVTYETYHIQVPVADTVVPSIEDKDEIIALADLICDQNGQVDTSDIGTWKVKIVPSLEDESCIHYKVTYQASYRSPAGKKQVQAESTIRVLK